MNRLTYTFLIIFFFGCANSKELKLINLKFEKSHYVESKSISVSGKPSKLYLEFHNIFNKLSEKQKVSLALKGNIISKFYSSLYLINIKSEKVMDVFSSNLNEHKIISYLNGCVLSETEISIEMLNRINEILNLKMTNNDFINQKITAYELQKTGKIHKIELEFINEQLELLYSIQRWKVIELKEIKKKMIKEVLKNKNSSKTILKTIKESTVHTKKLN